MARMALIASNTPQSQDAALQLKEMYDFVALDQAEIVIALGGDGHMLQVLHRLLEDRRDIPVFGMNLGTIGFLMNNWRPDGLVDRLQRTKSFSIKPLTMKARDSTGREARD
jgi:NAD+ kinase